MKLVICRDYKNCEDRIRCEHSKPHIIDTIEEDNCFKQSSNDSLDDCDCIDYIRIRKEKLKQLYNIQKNGV